MGHIRGLVKCTDRFIPNLSAFRIDLRTKEFLLILDTFKNQDLSLMFETNS
jgi:hypothetical protein